jgi:hypothetical protein
MVKFFSQSTLPVVSDPGPTHATSANVTFDLKTKKSHHHRSKTHCTKMNLTQKIRRFF